jgi:uncharacterized delta-60 repeat protein
MKTLTFPNAGALLVALCCVTEGFAAVDRSFRLGAGLAGGDEEGGHCIVPLADGRLLVGGDFGTYNGVTRPDLVLLHANGSLDESLHLLGGVNGPDEPAIRSAGLQPDGKIIVSGNFTTISGVAARFARLHPDGTLDTAWLPQFRRLNGWVRSIVLPDGRVLAWNLFGIERLNADGSSDTSFDIVLDDFRLNGVSLQADGRILLTGYQFRPSTSVTEHKVVRLHPDGSLDPTFAANQFGSAVYGGLSGARQMRDGRILVFGEFTSVAGRARPGLALLHPDGRLDITARFSGTGGYVRALPLSDGSIAAYGVRDDLLALGEVTVFTEPPKGQRLKGRPWKNEFTVVPTGYVYDIAEDGRGRILITGEFWALNGVRVPGGIARFLRRGHPLSFPRPEAHRQRVPISVTQR